MAAKNQLFNHLLNNLHDATKEMPKISTVALGFTKEQMLRFDMKKPRLLFYDMITRQFYDQGDSTKINKSEWLKINGTNFNRNKPLDNVKYYIPMNSSVIAESNQPLK